MFAASGLTIALLGAGPLDPPANGPRRSDVSRHALIHCTLHPEPGVTLQDATVMIADGKIQSIWTSKEVGDGGARGGPSTVGARIWDCTGMQVYAGFIDPYVEVEVAKPPADAAGRHWNSRVTPERSVVDAGGVGGLDKATGESLRKLGFTAAGVSPMDPGKRTGGVVRGSGAVVSLAPPDEEPSAPRPSVYLQRAFHAMAFETSRGGRGPDVEGGGRRGAEVAGQSQWESYPTAQMGAMALIRQTLIDAEIRDGLRVPAGGIAAGVPATSCLDAISRQVADAPLLFTSGDELDEWRAMQIAREFGRAAIIVGTGTEYRRMDALKTARAAQAGKPVPFVVPLNFPRTPDVSSVGRAEEVDLRTLIHWEQAPSNALHLEKAGFEPVLTTAKLRDRAEFARNLRKVIDAGVSPDAALAMVTTRPAALLGVQERMGTVKLGMIANLVVADGDLFKGTPANPAPAKAKGANEAADDAKAKEPEEKPGDAKGGAKDKRKAGKPRDPRVMAVWIDGKRFEIERSPLAIAGDWKVEIPGAPAAERKLVIAGEPGAPKVTVSRDGKTVDAKTQSLDGDRLSIVFDHEPLDGQRGMFTMSGTVERDATGAPVTMAGSGIRPDGATFQWSAKREVPPPVAPEAAAEPKLSVVPAFAGMPVGPFAFTVPPSDQDTVFSHATVWTSGARGVIQDASIVTSKGKILFVGTQKELGEYFQKGVLITQPWREVDATGKHISAGIIDCHSHTGLKGVNESGRAVTSECRIEDETTPDDPNWYRQLAGGVTCVNSLHGSANAIGGQSLTQKLRWGCIAIDGMKFVEAAPGIKFALGENPKRGNSGSTDTTRYPQTRMGVEALIRDRFTAAQQYALTRGKPGFRRDLELEPLVEVLEGKRLMHCHSYRQDEIVMLARVAQDFKFKIGTYQHILEGYKVAEFVRDFSGGASGFADWWAYKVEVQDAIPQGLPLMAKVGCVVSFNSDDSEMARRLNAEAAKAVKYGDLPPEAALAFVTINPAKQLKIDQYVGSLEAGKHADLVVWSGPPLSSMSRCEQTWIDGRPYFTLAQDAANRVRDTAERQRIIQKILAGEEKDDRGAKRPRGSDASGGEKKPEESRGMMSREFMRMLEEGLDPYAVRAGECGCGQIHSTLEATR